MSDTTTRAARRARLIEAGAIESDQTTDDEGTVVAFGHSSATPNVVVANPRVRRVATIVLGCAGLALGSVMIADGSSPDFDVTAITTPAFAVYTFLSGAFGLAVITPNIPRE